MYQMTEKELLIQQQMSRNSNSFGFDFEPNNKKSLLVHYLPKLFIYFSMIRDMLLRFHSKAVKKVVVLK